MNDPIADFKSERAERISHQGQDAALRERSLKWLIHSAQHNYSYNFTWLGRPVIQYPQDLMATQELIWATRPDLIIETGIAHGGSLLFWASVLQLLGGDRCVLGIDVDIRPHNRHAIESHPLADRIELIEGSSIDDAVVQRVRAAADRHQRVMVLLDSDHRHAHVLRELELYAPLVTAGCYLIVFDTIIRDLPAQLSTGRPWTPHDNPYTALLEFLAHTDRFEVDSSIPDKLLITVAPDGYLRCVKD